MNVSFTPAQDEARRSFRAFADACVAPHAAEYDRTERIPREHVDRLAAAGYLAAALPAEYGGRGMDAITYGLLHEELGRASACVQAVVNVHNMATQPILRWGLPALRREWLPWLAAGERLAAFALTEPEVGSDLRSVATKATLDGDAYVLDGCKRWITCAQLADVFVLLARTDAGPTAFVVERERPGLTVTPITGLIGCRAYMLGEVQLDGVRVPRANLLARPGFGLSQVAATGLDAGRCALAWSCVGLAQACLDACLAYTSTRRQFGAALCDHQLVQRMISRMVVNVRAARLLCCEAASARERRDPAASLAASVAKYFASTMLGDVARDALQLHGANGCGSAYPVARYLRDATIMEIIEGTTQMQELIIARHAVRGFDTRAAVADATPRQGAAGGAQEVTS